MSEDEADLRRRWRDLVERRLPQAARERVGWPVVHDHCFARILLDHVHGRPWREVVTPPAWANTAPGRLARAIETGEAVLAGEVDLRVLNAASLRMRGRRQGARSA